jgi:MFS family permease
MLRGVHTRPAPRLTGYPKAFWYLLVGMLVNGTATFVVPFEAMYLVAARHLPVSQASAIVGVYGIGSCVSALAGGWFADTIGRRPTILVGLFCLAATTFGLAVATDIWLITALTFSTGFWISWYRPASSAVVVDLVPLDAQARANSLVYWAYNVGMAISPLLASVMVQNIGYTLLFCIDGCGTVLFCVLMLIGLPETRPAVPTRKHHDQNTVTPRPKSVWRDAPFLSFVLLSFVLTSIYFQNSSTLPADMQLHGFDATQYGIAISINGIVVVVLGLPLSHLLARLAPFRALAVSALFLGAGFGLTALADSLMALPSYMGSIALWTIGEILFMPVSATVVATFSPTARRGTYQGIARTAWGLSACAGPLLGGYILQFWGDSLWIGCAALGTLTACGFLVLGQVTRQCQGSKEDAVPLSEAQTISGPDLAKVGVSDQHPVMYEGVQARERPADTRAAVTALPWKQEREREKQMTVKKSRAHKELAEPLAVGTQPDFLTSSALLQQMRPSPEMEVYLAACPQASGTQEQSESGPAHLNAEMRKDRYLKNACEYAVYKLMQQKGLDLLGRLQLLNELIVDGIIPYELLKEQMSALFAELCSLAGKIDEANDDSILATLQTLIENMCVSHHRWSIVLGEI